MTRNSIYLGRAYNGRYNTVSEGCENSTSV